MFLGTHAPRLDEKGRLFLPAKFREELAEGLVITKGQERCLYVFPTAEFGRLTEALRTSPVTHKGLRDYSRVFFASASDEVPDRQGRITIPPRAARVRRADPRLRGDRREHPGRDLGRRGLGDLPHRPGAGVLRPRRGGAARRPLARRSAQRAATPPCAPRASRPPAARSPGSPSPVPGERTSVERQGTPTRAARTSQIYRRTFTEGSRTAQMDDGSCAARRAAADTGTCPCCSSRVLELFAPALADPNAVVVDATLGMAGHAEALLVAHPQVRLVGIDRDTDALALAAARLAALRAAHHAGARGLRPAAGGARSGSACRPSTACCSTSGSPRCSSTRSSAASPTRTTRRSTCGWTGPPGRPRPTS